MPIGTKAHFSQHTGICVGRKKNTAWWDSMDGSDMGIMVAQEQHSFEC